MKKATGPMRARSSYGPNQFDAHQKKKNTSRSSESKTEVDIKKDDKKENIRKEEQLQLQKERKPPREADIIMISR